MFTRNYKSLLSKTTQNEIGQRGILKIEQMLKYVMTKQHNGLLIKICFLLYANMKNSFYAVLDSVEKHILNISAKREKIYTIYE
jgi:hypothetical protein